MTPLAMAITKQLTLPIKDRTFDDKCGLLDRMSDIHCFEVSEVFEAIRNVAFSIGNNPEFSKIKTFAFLPAPRTWIEYKFENGDREGVLLDGFGLDGLGARTYWACGSKKYNIFCSQSTLKTAIILGSDVPAMFQLDKIAVARALPGESEARMRGWTWWLYAALAFINTPRIIGRRQHMPHRGLEKAMINRMGVGKFPLHAWTEIVLQVTPPRDVSGDASIEAHYTGQRALHFCRAHLRLRNGQLEHVRAHWRGDPALGIKRSRYRLAPATKAAP